MCLRGVVCVVVCYVCVVHLGVFLLPRYECVINFIYPVTCGLTGHRSSGMLSTYVGALSQTRISVKVGHLISLIPVPSCRQGVCLLFLRLCF